CARIGLDHYSDTFVW
nr:immunoglobulin heavy chain junction region [Macaca mulatta]MOV49453.1 immunoglobulin heavy chain junction region [Macaca mulatta]MOV50683.1 immunoglobulin heavy chain junction region [Macaca mulatta]MOV50850.1 immunoglobulin heavy chain junction region [Macaca mulatta]MOV51183.1 immunoglobulin heavy chain junction region [Macaca mulatta]